MPSFLLSLRAAALSGAFAFSLFLACLVPAAAGEAWVEPQTFTLDNGMQVVILPDHRAPVVTHMVWYKVGAADEPWGKSGLAHFLEHLMFKGTDDVPPQAFSKIVARHGGQDNAFTSYDYTAYFQRVAKDRLPLVMELEADRMADLKLTEEVVTPERLVVLEERRNRVDNDPAALFREQLQATQYLSHPYGVPVIGWAHEIAGLSLADAQRFYKEWYRPDNAILVVAGDITAEELRPLAEKYYGAIPAGDRAPRLRPVEPPQIAARRIEMRHPQVKQPIWSRTYLAPSYTTAKPGEAEALEVLAEILGGGPTSRLYRQLLIDQKLAVSASAWYDGINLDDGRFGLSVVPRPEVTPASLDPAIEAVLREVIDKGVSAEEVERAKRRLRAATVYAQDSQQTMAQWFGAGLASGLDVADLVAWPERIAAVTPQDVQRVARAFLRPGRSVTGVLEAEPAA